VGWPARSTHTEAAGRPAGEADLTGIADRRVDRLSGAGPAPALRDGHRGRPDRWLLDEPTTAMDVEARQAVLGKRARLRGPRHHRLFATHYLEEGRRERGPHRRGRHGRVVTTAPEQDQSTAGQQRVRFNLGDESIAASTAPARVTRWTCAGPSVTLRTTDAEATVRALFAARDRVPDIE